MTTTCLLFRNVLDGGWSRESLLDPKIKRRTDGNKKLKGLKRAGKQATGPHDQSQLCEKPRWQHES
jgi:hypothetical protein